MKALLQRVRDAKVSVEGKTTGAIEKGLLIYLGVAKGDSDKDADWIAEKAASLRIFDDDAGKMNLSVKEIKGAALVVSQFTLLADARKGRRPSYHLAAPVEEAKRLYEYCIEALKKQNIACESGVFQACMEVSYTNAGPVSIMLDSEQNSPAVERSGPGLGHSPE
jgi:D-tyrosyl-tRNA(Tyr) deacylase